MAENEKNIVVIVGDLVHDVVMHPCTRVDDILDELGVGSGYWLSNREGRPFGLDDNVYAVAQEGEKFVATAPCGGVA